MGRGKTTIRISGLIIVTSMLLLSPAQAQFLTLRTLSQFGGAGSQSTLAVSPSVDLLTNAYFVGTFDASATMGSITLTNTSPCTNIFAAKFNPVPATNQPSPVWVVAPTIDAPLSDLRIGTQNNPASGILAGSFIGTNVAFGSFAITNAAPGTSSDIFLGKYSTTGIASWLVRFGGTDVDQCGDLAVDLTGNSYLTGSFQSASFSAGPTNLTRQSTSGSDCFVLKCNSSGVVQWARGGSYAAGRKIAFDKNNNIYVAGTTSGASSFDGLTPTNPTTGQFIIEYSTAGVPLWSRGDITIGSQLAVDRATNIISAGTFSGVIHCGSIALTNPAPATIFIAKFDTNGNALWAKQLPGLGHDTLTAMLVDTRTNYWLTGSLAADDGGNPVGAKAFLACFGPAGNLVGEEAATGSGVSAGNGLTVVLNGVFWAGTFSTNITFLDQSLTNNGDADVFLMKFNPVPPGIKTAVVGTNLVQSWPTPATLGLSASETFSLEESTNLGGWAASSNAPAVISGQYVITNAITGSAHFYRLRK